MDGRFADVVFSGGLIHGQYIQSGTAYAVPAAASLTSGNVQSGHVASGAVPGYFGPTRAIQSGTVGSFDFGSGAVMAGQIGSGAVQSGQIASGSIGLNHLASGSVRSGVIASGQIGTNHLASGAVRSGQLGNGAVIGQAGVFTQNVTIASGTISTMDLADGSVQAANILNGAVIAGKLGSGAVVSGVIAGGQVGTGHLANNAIVSGKILANSVGSIHLNSGLLLDVQQTFTNLVLVEAVSGQKAVVWASGGHPRIQAAKISSGQWTSPCVGVTETGGASGATVRVITQGIVNFTASGMMGSGFHGEVLYAGSGGVLKFASGTHAGGASSGGGACTLSGQVVIEAGQAISGGIWVQTGSRVFNQSGAPIARRGFII